MLACERMRAVTRDRWGLDHSVFGCMVEREIRRLRLICLLCLWQRLSFTQSLAVAELRLCLLVLSSVFLWFVGNSAC